LEIIPAHDSHVPQILELWKELMDFHKNLNAYWSRRQDGHIAYEKIIRAMLESKDAIVLVAVDKGRVVAYSCARINKPSLTREQDSHGDITDMMVNAEYQRKGIGKQVLKMIFEWFESQNIDWIGLSVAANNQIGYPFWKKQGFQDYEHRLYLKK
jgi:ribosomal protein S18 acetylase RimI-like enzyme